MERMTRERFKDWYYKVVNDYDETKEETISLTFKHHISELFYHGKSHKDLWYKDYLIWKLRQ